MFPGWHADDLEWSIDVVIGLPARSEWMAWELQLSSVWHLLLADGWHDIAPSRLNVSTFDLGTVEYYVEADCRRRVDSFSFRDGSTGRTIYGPVTAVLAVDTTPLDHQREPTDHEQLLSGMSYEQVEQLESHLLAVKREPPTEAS